MYLISLFGFSFAILSMAEMSSMYVAIGGSQFCSLVTDTCQGSYIWRTIPVSDLTPKVFTDLPVIMSRGEKHLWFMLLVCLIETLLTALQYVKLSFVISNYHINPSIMNALKHEADSR